MTSQQMKTNRSTLVKFHTLFHLTNGFLQYWYMNKNNTETSPRKY